MKFTNGYWLDPEGMTVVRARQIRSVMTNEDLSTITVFAPTQKIETRGDTLNTPEFTVTYSALADGVISVRIERMRSFATARPLPPIHLDPSYRGIIHEESDAVELVAGELSVRIPRFGSWDVRFNSRGNLVTASQERAVAHASTADGRWTIEQLSMTPGERIYGLGERFGAFTKNGQSIDIWNEDGGTTSEQAYKNVAFYMSSRGYGVYVRDSADVSFEVASEMVTRTQFSVSGDSLEYLIIDGPTPKDVLRRYTALTGRPPKVPAWSYGLWLTTSFTTSYDEETVTSFVDGMTQRGLPLSVFHFDCFWMREFHWCDFIWDPCTFPDPEGMLKRLKEKGLKICVWINPYIAQRSYLFDEGAQAGYLVKRTDGGVWQTDLWQSGMALVDFTNPEAVEWYRNKLRALLDMGVDCFKTDFGERIPVTGIQYFDGSCPLGMHNHYTYLYNKTVFELLREVRGEGEAVLFARSSTAGGQTFPVHWGGDCMSTQASMGETLRGGMSLAMSGFGYWSHDIGGFEGTPDPGVFKRWLAFGLLGSHSRLHGSNSVRVPWAFDEEAVDVTRFFTSLKMQLMPYIGQAAREVQEEGIPIMRPMILEFPEDLGTRDIDTQYMLGSSLLVAPVFSSTGDVDVYLPQGEWTSLIDEKTARSGWKHEVHDFFSLPLNVRKNTVLPWGKETQRPDYDWADGVTLRCFALEDGYASRVVIPSADAGVGVSDAVFDVELNDDVLEVKTDSTRAWAVEIDGERYEYQAGTSYAQIMRTGGDE